MPTYEKATTMEMQTRATPTSAEAGEVERMSEETTGPKVSYPEIEMVK